MSFRDLSNATFHCYLCGHEGPAADFERGEVITIRVLGEPFRQQLFRCWDHEACTARVRAQADAAAMAQQVAS